MYVLILLLFPLAAALAVLISGNKLSKTIALIASFFHLAFTKYLYWFVIPNAESGLSYTAPWIPAMKASLSFQADGLSYIMVLLTNFLIPVIILATYNRTIKNSAVFYSLILAMQFALNGVFLAADGLLFYVFWELALLPVFFISWLWSDEPNKGIRNKAIFKFFIYTIAGSLFMLAGMIMLYAKTNSFAINDWYNSSLTIGEQSVIFWLIFIAFAIKIPVFPFHTWQPETYRVAPTAGTMLLSGIMLKMGIYGIIRWLMPVVPGAFFQFTPIVIVLATIGIVYGSVIAIMQNNLKRLLAYSSFAHVGLIVAGIFSFSMAGLQGAIVQSFAHGVNVVALFFAADIIFNRLQTNEIDRMGGIRLLAPKFATGFMIAVLASVALPTTNAFIGEFLLLFGVYSYNTILSVFAGLTIILGAVYMLRMYQRVMLGEERSNTASFADLTKSELLVFLLLGITIFICGLYPNFMLELINPVIENLMQISLR